MKKRRLSRQIFLNSYTKGTVIITLLLLLTAGCVSTSGTRFCHIDEKNSYMLRGRQGELILSGINRHFIYKSTTNYNNMSPVEFLNMAKDHSIQIIRVFIPEGWPTNICDEKGVEWPLGHYSEEFLEELDKIFLAARERNLYIILALFDAYKFSVCWEKTVYAQLGEDRCDFFAKTLQRKLWRNGSFGSWARVSMVN